MQRDFWGEALGEFTTWIWLAIGVGLLVFVGIAVAVVYYFFLYLMMLHRYQQLQVEAGEAFDAALLEHGDFEAEHVVNVVYGTAAAGRGSHSAADLIFGVGVRRDD